MRDKMNEFERNVIERVDGVWYRRFAYSEDKIIKVNYKENEITVEVEGERYEIYTHNPIHTDGGTKLRLTYVNTGKI